MAVRYLLSDDQLIVEGQAQVPVAAGTAAATFDQVSELSELSEVILDALVDEHEFVDDTDGPRFRLLKQHKP